MLYLLYKVKQNKTLKKYIEEIDKMMKEKDMKFRGITRRIDDLGRIVIPKEYRKTLGINELDELEIFLVEDGGVYIKPIKKED